MFEKLQLSFPRTCSVFPTKHQEHLSVVFLARTEQCKAVALWPPIGFTVHVWFSNFVSVSFHGGFTCRGEVLLFVTEAHQQLEVSSRQADVNKTKLFRVTIVIVSWIPRRRAQSESFRISFRTKTYTYPVF